MVAFVQIKFMNDYQHWHQVNKYCRNEGKWDDATDSIDPQHFFDRCIASNKI